MRRALVCLCLAAWSIAVPATLRAQATGNVVANAVILLPPVTGNGVRALDFGQLAPGNTIVLPGAATTSGQFLITGMRNANRVTVTLDLPGYLANVVTPSVHLPLTFNGAYAQACIQQKNGTEPCSAAWNPTPSGTPHQVAVTGPPGQRTGNMSVYVGGQVTSTGNEIAGLYQGTITMTFAVQ